MKMKTTRLSFVGVSHFLLYSELISHLGRMMKKWDGPVYAFFKPTPAVKYVSGRKAHVFECAAGQCRCKISAMRDGKMIFFIMQEWLPGVGYPDLFERKVFK